jgi:hypothetical protein
VANKIRQHVPNFVDIDRYKIRSKEFNTQEELLAIPWVASNTKDEGFYRFSVDVSYTPALPALGRAATTRYYLMAERDNGLWWWVIGYLDSLEGIDLPKWEPKYGEAKED